MTCSLFGYPGVSFLDADRRQLGPPAVRSVPGGAFRRFSLKRGAVGAAMLTTLDNQEENCPRARVSTFVRVFPPSQRVALTVRYRFLACRGAGIQAMSPDKYGH